MSPEPSFLLPTEETLAGVLGFEHLELGAERCVGRFTVARKHLQPMGLVHGGVYAALAEGLVSHATAYQVGPEGMVAQGMSQNLNFLRPVFDGTVEAVGVRRHRGRTTWVWDVDMTDDAGRLCVTTRLTVAIRPMPDAIKRQLGLA